MKIILADDPNNRLREPSEEVTDFEELPALVESMIGLMGNHPGISAPQVGRNLRLFVVNKSNTGGKDHLVAVNPQVTPLGGKATEAETCLSLPNRTYKITRRKRCRMKYQDLAGQRRSIFSKGFVSRIIFHEEGHLDGILIDEK